MVVNHLLTDNPPSRWGPVGIFHILARLPCFDFRTSEFPDKFRAIWRIMDGPLETVKVCVSNLKFVMCHVELKMALY